MQFNVTSIFEKERKLACVEFSGIPFVSLAVLVGIVLVRYMHVSLTGARGDVAFLVLLCWPQAGLTSVSGLRVTAGPLAAADSLAAVSAALGPGTPGRPAAIHSVS